jgi:predicted nucleic acid-binding protein
MRIYLDSCCYSRPFDSHNQERIRREAEAVLAIIESTHVKVACAPLFWETAAIADGGKRMRVNSLLSLARHEEVDVTAFIARVPQIAGLGFRAMDSAQIACAELVAADWFLSTDDRLLRRAERAAASLKVAVANPAAWVLIHLP